MGFGLLRCEKDIFCSWASVQRTRALRKLCKVGRQFRVSKLFSNVVGTAAVTSVKTIGRCFPGGQDKKQLEKPRRGSGMFGNSHIPQRMWELQE